MVQTLRPSGIELRTELGHAVFVVDIIRADSELVAKQRVKVGAGNITATAFVSAGFHGTRSSGQREGETALIHPLEKIEESECGAEQADRLLDGLQPLQVDHTTRRDKALARCEHAEHVAQRGMRGFIRMRCDDEKRPGRKSSLTPSLAHRCLVNLECAEMVFSVSFAGRPAGAERLLGLFRGKAAQVGVFESFLGKAGNLPPISRRFPNCHAQAKRAVRRIVTELIRMQPQEQVAQVLIPLASDHSASILLQRLDFAGLHASILPVPARRQTTF